MEDVSSKHASKGEHATEVELATTIERAEAGPNVSEVIASSRRSLLARMLLMTAVVGVYFAQTFHIVGTGFLTNTITQAIGGASLGTWLTSVLTITLTAMGPLVCQGSDFWGRKWFVVVLTSTGLIGSLVMSRSNSIGVAITGQVIAGFAQSSQPVIHAIASEIIPRKHRSLAQASINTASVLGGVSGLLIAGALTRSNAFGFRRYYYIAAAIYGAAALAFTIFYNPPPRELETALTLRGKLAHLDWVGYGLLVAGSVLLCFALTSSVSSSWTSAVVLAPLLVGALVLGIFGLYEWKFRKDGLVHHGLFSRGRNFYVAIFCIFAEGMVFFAAISYYSAESVLVYGTGAFDAGLYFTVAWWLLLVFAWAAGSYISWSKTIRLPTMGAFLLLALFGALMASLNPTTQSNMVGYAVFVGAGLGVALNSLVVVAQLSIPPELITAATALMITTRSLGGTVALSVYSAIFNHVSHKEIGTRVIKALLPLGFDSQYVEPLIGGLLSHNSALLKTIPGLTPEIMQAAGMAIKEAFSLAFRYVWITSMVASVLALCASAFLVDPKSEFTAHTDAPMDKVVKDVRPARAD